MIFRSNCIGLLVFVQIKSARWHDAGKNITPTPKNKFCSLVWGLWTGMRHYQFLLHPPSLNCLYVQRGIRRTTFKYFLRIRDPASALYAHCCRLGLGVAARHAFYIWLDIVIITLRLIDVRFIHCRPSTHALDDCTVHVRRAAKPCFINFILWLGGNQNC